MLVQANDELIRRLKRRRLFRLPVLAAIDYSDDRFYGKYNSKIRRSKKDRACSTHTPPYTSSSVGRG